MTQDWPDSRAARTIRTFGAASPLLPVFLSSPHPMKTTLIVAALAAMPLAIHAQVTTTAAVLPAAKQIVAAALPLPAEFRDAATVLGYRTGASALVTLRAGSGPFTCLASNPALPQFHVACYHQAMEPFMARGRALRAKGTKGDEVDSVRFREVRAGKLKMPNHPAALYSITGPAGSFDAEHETVKGTRSLYVVYIPGATSATTGMSAKPAPGTPWIMYPGTPKAHIMFVPTM